MSSQAASKSSGRFSSDSVHCAPMRISTYDGSVPRSSVSRPKRDKAAASPGSARRQPRTSAIATAKSVPTRSMAPSTCSRSGKLTSSGRIAASTSGPRLEDHQDEDDEHADRCGGVEDEAATACLERSLHRLRERLPGLVAEIAVDGPEHECR